MKTVSMSGSLRESVGKKDARKNRQQGLVPCVVYGGDEQIHFTLDEKEFGKLIFTPEVYQVSLELGSKTINAILQDVQYHPVTDSVLHVDFLQVLPGKPVVVGLPLKITGTARGVLRGGKLVSKFRKVKIKGLVEDIPDFIEINITKLDINGSIRIKDLSRPKLSFLDPQNSVVVTIKATRAGAPGALPNDEEEASAEGEAPAEN
ncbi:MAG: 50S ribosomal protein L25/general stress protein Ctc [Lentimicrobiaceae bacterium]|nr:50S ribosomal protein L25/general stress protein Ctc [Lentimicrobiaceae bacterium]